MFVVATEHALCPTTNDALATHSSAWRATRMLNGSRNRKQQKNALLVNCLHPVTSPRRFARLDFGHCQIDHWLRKQSIQVATMNFKTQLHNLIQLQRTAHAKQRIPDATTRKDRLTRAAT